MPAFDEFIRGVLVEGQKLYWSEPYQAEGYEIEEEGFLLDSRGLFNRVAFQEDCLFQCTEELLVGNRVLDGVKIELSAGSHDELRVVAVAD